MKKATITVTILLSMLWLCCFTAYAANRADVKNYNDGNYSRNIFAVFGFMQPYVEDYNMGNKYYMQKDYQKAIAYYEKALRKKPPHSHYNDDKYNKECSIRINIALSMIAQIDMDNMAGEDVGKALQIISDAKEILCENGCAENQNEGHSSQAVELYKELCNLEETLKQEDSDTSENQTDTEEEDNTEKKEENRAKEKTDQLMKNQSEGTATRNDTVDEMQRMMDDDTGDTYYDGKRW